MWHLLLQMPPASTAAWRARRSSSGNSSWQVGKPCAGMQLLRLRLLHQELLLQEQFLMPQQLLGRRRLHVCPCSCTATRLGTARSSGLLLCTTCACYWCLLPMRLNSSQSCAVLHGIVRVFSAYVSQQCCQARAVTAGVCVLLQQV
jgi:hypothetical protein